MLRLSLVDDDSAFLANLKAGVERHLAAGGVEHVVSAYPDAESFWKQYPANIPDIVFLDIMLPGDNGIRTARAIHASNRKILIVFLTSTVEFAMEGYGVDALFYLIKPIDDERIGQTLDACRDRLAGQNHIVVKTENGTVTIDAGTITHLESNNRQVCIHAPPVTHMYRGKLSDLAETLPSGFAQVHKSFYVNLDRVSAVKYSQVVLDDGQSVPVSRRFRKDATDRFFLRIAPPL